MKNLLDKNKKGGILYQGLYSLTSKVQALQEEGFSGSVSLELNLQNGEINRQYKLKVFEHLEVNS